MSNPSLSVVMSNYNHGKYIGRAIEAIVSQSRPPDEFIIMDDGSTDNSVEVIESYLQSYSYINFIKNNQKNGVVDSYNRLFKTAKGDYIYAAASDDYILPYFFERAMNMAECYPEAGIIFGKMVSVSPNGKELCIEEVKNWLQSQFVSPNTFLNEYIKLCHPGHSLCSATIYKREAFKEVGFFKSDLASFSDTFAVRAIAMKYGACYIAERCTVWTVWEDSFSGALQSDPRRMLDIIARASWLMRSHEFRDRFPESYVILWEKIYRDITITNYLYRFKSCFEIASKLYYQSLYINNKLYGFINRLFPKLVNITQYIGLKYLKYILNSYQGDISCLK
jgi:glycosyltransferase involved in cell wall biosynthesis